MALRDDILQLFNDNQIITHERVLYYNNGREAHRYLNFEKKADGRVVALLPRQIISFYLNNVEAFQNLEQRLIEVAKSNNGIIYLSGTHRRQTIAELPELADTLSGMTYLLGITRRTPGVDLNRPLFATGLYLGALLELAGYAELHPQRGEQPDQYIVLKPELWA